MQKLTNHHKALMKINKRKLKNFEIKFMGH